MREIVLDTETTGTERGHDRVVEIGLVELVDLMPTGRTFHVYVNPEGKRVHPEALKVHGLTDEFLKTHKPFKMVAGPMLRFIDGARLVAHNAPFDKGMLEAEFERLGLKLVADWEDTLPLARKVKKGGLHNLDVLCKHYGVGNKHRTLHGALLDAQLLAEVYLHLRGGRQFGFELGVTEQVTEEDVDPEDARLYGAHRVFKSRLTQAEAEAHVAFMTEIKNSVWSSYDDQEKISAAA